MLVGPRVLGNFLLGRYHTPLKEERIFLFLDIADSTKLAEQLGDVEAQKRISRFFFDIAAPITQCGGETHRYIGDEIVVTWPLGDKQANARCLNCVFAIKAVAAKRRDNRLKEQEHPIEFRIGLHGGPVVASEVGDDKREIVYFGDTVNTAARIEQQCKPLGQNLLISKDLLERIALPERLESRPLGAVTLSGKADPMSLYTIVKTQ